MRRSSKVFKIDIFKVTPQIDGDLWSWDRVVGTSKHASKIMIAFTCYNGKFVYRVRERKYYFPL